MLIRAIGLGNKTGVQRMAAINQAKHDIEEKWKAAKRDLQGAWPYRDHTLIFLIHEGNQSISSEDANDIITEIDLLEKDHPVDVILHTHGGGAMASDRIATALVEHSNTAAYMPLYAMSGGTEIALATERVVFGKGAALSPCDIQFNGVPALDIIELAKQRGDDASEELVLLAKTAQRVIKDEAKRVNALINRRHKGFLGWRGDSLARELTSGIRYHGDLIRYKEARRLGIRASKRLPKLLYRFISLRREQLRLLRELEEQITLVQEKIAAEDRNAQVTDNVENR